jgi:hypothetical protein
LKIFWSWQSDTPGKIGKHFVRKALEEAVAVLREPSVIEDPIEREAKEAMHVDQDRQGVAGSPDLAKTILEKIAAASVFIADVTPVSTMPSPPAEVEKRNMNPNVAIELGYALSALSDAKVLMVLNEHFGDRRFLPFDLAHKAGPISFRLAPDATKPEINAELGMLRGKLVNFLRPYLDAAVAASPTTVLREPVGASQAVFYQPRDTLATIGEDSDYTEFSAPDARGVFLRVIPRRAVQQPFSAGLLDRAVRESGLGPLWPSAYAGIRSGNGRGAIAIEPVRQGPDVYALTQAFRNGELWGVNRRLLVDDQQRGKYVPAQVFEATIGRSLRDYCKFLSEKLEMRPPYDIVAGAVGLAGFKIAFTDWTMDWYGPLHDNEFSVEFVLSELTEKAFNALTAKISDGLFYLSGYPRPAGQFGLQLAADELAK